MVLTRFPTLTGLVSTPPVLHPCFSLASSASCDAFTEQQTSFMEPGPCSTQARSSLGKKKCRDINGQQAIECQYIEWQQKLFSLPVRIALLLIVVLLVSFFFLGVFPHAGFIHANTATNQYIVMKSVKLIFNYSVWAVWPLHGMALKTACVLLCF